jgi:hypothetical protein
LQLHQEFMPLGISPSTQISTRCSPDLDWRKHELAFEEAFHRYEQILIVVQAPTGTDKPSYSSAGESAFRKYRPYW